METSAPTKEDTPSSPTTLTSFNDNQLEFSVQEAVEACKKQSTFYEDSISANVIFSVINSPEVFIKAWDFISINQWNKEQERLVIVTTGAYYRIKVKWN
jgi:hypothetical protein